MSSIPENFEAATYREGGHWRDISLTESMYAVYLERRDRKARKALKKMAGARWCRRGKCWLVEPERVRDLIAWAEKFMAGGAWTDDESVPEWRGIIDPRAEEVFQALAVGAAR